MMFRGILSPQKSLSAAPVLPELLPTAGEYNICGLLSAQTHIGKASPR